MHWLQLKEKLGDKISWDEIRLVLAKINYGIKKLNKNY